MHAFFGVRRDCVGSPKGMKSKKMPLRANAVADRTAEMGAAITCSYAVADLPLLASEDGRAAERK